MRPEVYIKSITFNDSSVFDFDKKDIIVFTGANNAGKSQILREIIQNFESPSSPTKVITTNIDAEYNGTISELRSEARYMNGQYCIGGISIHSLDYMEQLWNSHNLSSISRYFINHLTTEQRLHSATSPSSYNPLEQNPSHPIQTLYADDEKESELSSYFHKAFNSHIIVNRGAGSVIPLHVGEKPTMQIGEDRVSRSYLERLGSLPQLQTQGDGMRSFTGILLDVFTSKHTITLIDEPEAFLHPPQARLLGKMLAKNKPNDRQLFISTHSEDFLKGLLDADSDNVKIIRINREGNTNNMNLLDNNNIKHLWKDSILRYSNILSGLFHQKVVVCESDTDCRFYQAMMDSLYDGEAEISPDVLFTHCGGKDRLKVVIKALKALNVKTIAIADIDVLNEKTKFKEITDSLGIDWSALETNWKIIDEYVKTQRPQLDTDDVKIEINKILDSVSINPFPKSDVEKIKKILKSSTAWSKIKEVGKSFFNGGPYIAYSEINSICSSKGLYIVPVGELEYFYKPKSNMHGTQWVNEVLENIDLKIDLELQDAREFIKRIIEA